MRSRGLGDVYKRQAWFQLYPLKDQKTSDRLIERAQAAGCDKLVVTVDVPALGAREWDQRNYSRPLKLSPSSVLDVLLHPRWLWQVMLPRGAPEFSNLTEFLPAGARSALQGVRFMGTQINPTLAWSDIEPGSYFDPAILEPYESRGTVVHVGNNDTVSKSLTVIP